MSVDTKLATKKCYEDYYSTKQADRNNLLSNPEVLFQSLAFDASICRALGSINCNPYVAKVLDVGCGSGGSLFNFIRLGFAPKNLYGIDILDERVNVGKLLFPNLNLISGDASKMPYQDNYFDIVFESTMFLQITDNCLASQIGDEIIRVTKPQGYIILTDWRYGKVGRSGFNAVNTARIRKLFHVGNKTHITSVHRGAIIPPIGRFLSKKLPATYFLVQSLFPTLVGQLTTVLRKC